MGDENVLPLFEKRVSEGNFDYININWYDMNVFQCFIMTYTYRRSPIIGHSDASVRFLLHPCQSRPDM